MGKAEGSTPIVAAGLHVPKSGLQDFNDIAHPIVLCTQYFNDIVHPILNYADTIGAPKLAPWSESTADQPLPSHICYQREHIPLVRWLPRALMIEVH